MAMNGETTIHEDQALPLVDFSIGQFEGGSKFDVKMYKSSETLESRKRKMVCETPTMQYIGSNFAHDPSRDYINQYLIIRDNKTGKKRIFSVENYKLHPVVKREDEVDSETERLEAMKKVLNESRTFVERQDDLTETFGSKIKRKAMETRQRNKVSDATEVIKASVQSFVESEGVIGGDKGDGPCLSIVPYDKDATEEDQVYPLESIIPTSIRRAAVESAEKLDSPTADQIKSWKEEKNPLGSRYIAWRACHLHPSVANDEDTKLEYLSCLQMLAYFMKFYAPTGTTQSKKDYLDAIDSNVKEWFRTMVSPDAKYLSLQRRLPAQIKDKILAYAVILAWHIDSCQFDVQMLAEGFGISEKKLTTVIRALGGKIKQVVKEGLKRTVGYLQLPLVFPKQMKRR